LFLSGTILVAAGTGLFWWGATTTLTPAEGLTPSEVMGRIGQIAGAIGGLGVAIWVMAMLMRLRGR
jgi:hypothetical protein